MRTRLLTVCSLIAAAAPAAHGQNWFRTQKLTASGGAAWDALGISVAIAGDTLAVGAPQANLGSEHGPGAVHVFERAAGAWAEVAVLTASDGTLGDAFGGAVALAGDTLVVGAAWDDDAGDYAGSAYVFERDSDRAGTWIETAKLVASDARAESLFGYSVAVYGSLTVVGAPKDGVYGTGSNAVYVFGREGDGYWGELQKLTAQAGGPDDLLGLSVAIHSTTIVAGAPGAERGAGAAHVFEAQNSHGQVHWKETARIQPTNVAEGDLFGWSASCAGETTVIGAPLHGNGGAVYVSEADTVHELTASNVVPGATFGLAVSTSGATIAVGDDAARTVFVFERDGAGVWNEVAVLKPCDEDFTHGYTVAVSDRTVAVGKHGDETNGFASGSAYTYEPLALAAPESYCTAGSSFGQCQARLSACGLPSASATSGFVLAADGLEVNRKGFFFYASNGRQAVQWGNGTSYQCVAPPVQRSPLKTSSGPGNGCGGGLLEDLAAFWSAEPGKQPGVGAAVQAQLWFRDKFNTGNRPSTLSDAIEFSVLP